MRKFIEWVKEHEDILLAIGAGISIIIFIFMVAGTIKHVREVGLESIVMNLWKGK